jgi:hypothetical protein
LRIELDGGEVPAVSSFKSLNYICLQPGDGMVANNPSSSLRSAEKAAGTSSGPDPISIGAASADFEQAIERLIPLDQLTNTLAGVGIGPLLHLRAVRLAYPVLEDQTLPLKVATCRDPETRTKSAMAAFSSWNRRPSDFLRHDFFVHFTRRAWKLG